MTKKNTRFNDETREKLLKYVAKKKDGRSTADCAKQFKAADSTIVYHLRKLAAAGEIVSPGRGGVTAGKRWVVA